MGEYMSVITGVFLAFLQIMIVRKIMDVFLQERNNNILKYVVWAMYFTFATAINLTDIVRPIVLIFSNILFIFSLAMLDRKTTIKIACFFSLIVCSSWMLVEVGAVIVVEKFGIDFVENRDAVCFVSLLIMLAIVVILNKSCKGAKYGDIPFKYFLMILSIPIISIYLTNRIFLMASHHNEYNNIAVVSSIFLLMMNYIIFEVYTWISRDAELKSLNKLYGQQLELCSRQAAEQEQLYMEIKRTRHEKSPFKSSWNGRVRRK